MKDIPFDRLPEEERLLVYAKTQHRQNKIEPFQDKPSNMPVYLALGGIGLLLILVALTP